MIYADDLVVFEQGTLPVNVAHDSNPEWANNISDLKSFVGAATKVGESSSVYSDIGQFITLGKNDAAQVVIKPPTTDWDTSGYWGDSTMSLDPTGNGNEPWFGLYDVAIQRIDVPGLRYSLPSWGGFGLVDFQPTNNGLPGPTDPCVSGAADKIDWAFISAREGLRVDHMYVPTATDGTVLGHSGATIATGFDVGNHGSTDLANMGLSDSLITKLTPYLGKTGADGLAYVNSHPLTLTEPELTTIDAAVHSEALARVVKSYDSATDRPGAFWALPAEAQTVIASVAFQYYGAITTMSFWTDVVTNNWTAAASELQHFNDPHPSRRNLEANYLNSGIYSGHVNNGSPC